MIRTQSLQVLMYTSDANRPRQWQGFHVHRNHSFGGDTHEAKSHALFCPSCKEVWAVLRFLDENEVWAVNQFCEHCKPERELEAVWHPVPGSILVEEGWGLIDEALLYALPEPLVKREYLLHERAYS